MKVIELNSQRPNLRFIKHIAKFTEINSITNEEIVTYRVVIKLKNLDNGRSRIHRYSDFLNNWRNRRTKTAMDIADYLVPFLNYITFELSSQDLPSVQHLTFEHGAEYLINYGKDRARSTVLKCERVITEFYYFLTERNLLFNIKKSDFIIVVDEKVNTHINSPFKTMVLYPAAHKEERLHHLDEDLVFGFLFTALQVAPQIALGTYIQFFGGLRVSEVVNVTYTSITPKGPFCKNGMIIDLRKRDLRKDLKENARTSVKKPRKQLVIPVGDLLLILYQYHIKHYRQKETDAVFVDVNNKPMSKQTYTYNFEKVKKSFLDKLRHSTDPRLKIHATTLSIKKWSTHLCRGVFSNMVADSAENASEIASLRGDSSLESALSYISDSRKVERKLIENMNRFYSDKLALKFQDVINVHGGI